MRIPLALLALLLVACGQQQTEDLTAALTADPARLKALRAQCEADRHAAGEDACRAAAEAFRVRFFSGSAGPDEYNTLEELPAIPPSFDTPPLEDEMADDAEPADRADDAEATP
ncbi:hypothetical protein [Pseudoxanthomonas winnipegensis]|jgi:hypothetical protein|uniref:Lipoprotein n=1 Tax=Rhodanobacter denitrificans TaxID=666685 RepID=A0A2W5K144_9GAMM|nr:hypothetical protein [Pseudoxanthomonas winnipegensis]PZQ10806.1 MAG: hypothetical protein DI564_15030 [Rhodanobacter denitrificans]RZZ90236.1 hypothetical protein EA663_00240 [Pseudoxanthomonas winnipegensis]